MQYNFDKQMEKPLPKWTCLFKKKNNNPKTRTPLSTSELK